MDLQKKSYEIGFIKYVTVMKYLLNTVQQELYFASKYLKWTFEKSHVKSVLSNMVLVRSVQQTRSNRSNVLLIDMLNEPLEKKSHEIGSIKERIRKHYKETRAFKIYKKQLKYLRSSSQIVPIKV